MCVLPCAEVEASAPSWRRVLEDWEPECLLAGLPLSLSGDASAQTERVRKRAQSIAAKADLPLFFADERLSSSEAKRILHEQGLSEKAMRGRVDMIAASLFLQAWLDARLER